MSSIQILTVALAFGAATASAQDVPAAAPKVLDSAGALFGVRESVESIALSPSGRRIVYITPGKGSISSAYVADLAGGPHTLVTQSSGVPDRLRWCEFATETRLVCRTGGVATAAGILVSYSHLFAVDDDGKNPRPLGQRGSEFDARIRQDDGQILDWLPGEDGAILMAREYVPEEGKLGTRQVSKADGLGVDRIDVTTMKATRIEGANKLADSYLSDGHGNVRIKGYTVQRGGIETQLSERTQFHYRLPDSKEWVYFSDWEDGVGMWPLAIDADTNSAYVLKRLSGREALYRVKLDGSMAETLVYKNDHVDVDDVVNIDHSVGRVIGVAYTEDKTHIVYFDPEYDRLSRALGRAIPKLPQVDFMDASVDGNVLLIRAGSDTDPGRYFTFDKKAKTLNEIMLERPGLENVALATVTPMTYAAADGTAIPAYLTLPPGRADMKGLPAIVLPHGGPSSRDAWGFDWLPQYFAHQGYAVLQPNYRGSAGYGEAWLNENGFRNWRTSIGDVTAAGKWLLAQGADPARLDIVGWSYGGYAALQSAATEPGLFKAIVAIAPVTDLELFKKQASYYTNQTNVEEFIGDGPHVAEGSPLQNAARIAAPVLMFHGTLDLNVSVDQSRRMDAALKAAGGRSELVMFEGLDHGLVDSNVRAHMLDRIDAFLKASAPK